MMLGTFELQVFVRRGRHEVARTEETLRCTGDGSFAWDGLDRRRDTLEVVDREPEGLDEDNVKLYVMCRHARLLQSCQY